MKIVVVVVVVVAEYHITALKVFTVISVVMDCVHENGLKLEKNTQFFLKLCLENIMVCFLC